MSFHLFHLEHNSENSLQQQLRTQLTKAIFNGSIPLDKPLPSSRKLAADLKISRNTVIRVYEQMLSENLIVSKERSGYFINPQYQPLHTAEVPENELQDSVDWEKFLPRKLSEQKNIVKHQHWQRYKYPFIYGQFDPQSFPIAQWRECSRDSVSVAAIGNWASDQLQDDPMLIEHIQTHILPRRGIAAKSSQILITVGAQHAIYLTTRLVLREGDTFGIEDPNYVDVRNIALNRPAHILPLAIDEQGLVISEKLADCDCIYVTPSHQFPTTVTMSIERRKQLLQQAAEHNFLIIEDDYEAETNFTSIPSPALKSIDQAGRVIYVGSFSKTLAPGLRLGYMVADEALIKEAQALRRLMLRQAPMNNQRSVALFIARGYYDVLINKQRINYQIKWTLMQQALQQYIPDSSVPPTFGGSSYWVEGPAHLNADTLAQSAREQGILIEPGSIYYCDTEHSHCFRLGYGSISAELIEPGIKALADIINKLS
ncbi:MAG: PLP-dependent aminotransferase family protein [Oceanospirillaceae bacterium]